MAVIEGPEGPLDVLVSGHGDPVTVFAHGLASSIAETRPFGSGVRGCRVFLHFRGHGATPAPSGPWTYTGLQAELMAVVRRYDARRALGVSLGAGALLQAAWLDPGAFERLVFVLPSTIDRPRQDPAVRRMQRTADLVDRGDVSALAEALVADQPRGVRLRSDVAVWAQRRAQRLSGTAVARALRELPSQHPLAPGTDLSGVACPALVIGQDGDDAHPSEVARELAARLPRAELRVFDDAGLVWGHRAELRDLVSSFLNNPDHPPVPDR